MLQDDKVRAMLQKVRTIELRTRVAMNDALAGTYHSLFKGQGVNFEEIREYQPGDEVRFIDWNAAAKLGRPFIKIFKEERELTLLLALDISGSAGCGSCQQSKREYATEIASVLAMSALKNNDKVGLCLFSENMETYIPPQKGRQQLLRLIRDALFFQPKQPTTNLGLSLSSLGKMLKKKVILCLISDFLPTQASQTDSIVDALVRLNQHHDLLCMRIEDAREKFLPDVGYVALTDAETQERFYLDTHSKTIRKAFAEERSAYWNHFHRLCQRRGIDILPLQNGQPYMNELKKFFSSRRQARL